MTKLSPPPSPPPTIFSTPSFVQEQEEMVNNNKKTICSCNATIQQYTQKKQEDISSICGTKSSNADTESGYY